MKVDLKKVGKLSTEHIKKIGNVAGSVKNIVSTHKPKFIDEFKEFLKKYGVIGLAVAFVMGGATQKLVTATVQSLVMPIIAVVTPKGDWQTMTLDIWKFHFGIGQFLSAMLDFIIIGFVIFWIVKVLVRDQQPAKK